MVDVPELPGFLNRALSPLEQNAEWTAIAHLYAVRERTKHEPSAEQLAIARGKAKDDEVRALLTAHREQRERKAAAERIATMKESFEEKGYTPPPRRKGKRQRTALADCHTGKCKVRIGHG